MKTKILATAISMIFSTATYAAQPTQPIQKIRTDAVQAQSAADQYTQSFVIQIAKDHESMLPETILAELGLAAKTQFTLTAKQANFLQIKCPDIRSASDMARVLSALRESKLLLNSDPLFSVQQQSYNAPNSTQYLHTDPGWTALNDIYQAGSNGTNFFDSRVSDFVQFYEGSNPASSVVAVIDGGKPPRATSDLDPQLVGEANFADAGKFSDATDTDAGTGVTHGGEVASLMVALPDNGLGVSGITNNDKVVMVRAISASNTQAFALENSIRWAAGLPVSGYPLNNHPAKVVNISLATTTGYTATSTCPASIQSAIDDATNAGVIVVAGAGNQGYINGVGVPAFCQGVVAVGAADSDGTMSSFSNSSTRLNVSAPGTSIPLSDATGSSELVTGSGTSFAAPIVAGVIAAARNLFPAATPADILGAINNSGSFVQPKLVNTSTGTQTICAANDCGRLLDAIDFYQKLSSTTVAGGTVRAVKAIGSVVSNVSNTHLVAPASGTSLTFDSSNSDIVVDSTMDGRFEIQFDAQATSNSTNAQPVQTWQMFVTFQNGRVTEFSAPQPLSAQSLPATSNASSGGGGGGSLSLYGLIGLAALLFGFKRKET